MKERQSCKVIRFGPDYVLNLRHVNIRERIHILEIKSLIIEV